MSEFIQKIGDFIWKRREDVMWNSEGCKDSTSDYYDFSKRKWQLDNEKQVIDKSNNESQ